ncbi:MAG TPA: dihydrodipicolinate synthase family protein [Bacteroidales bacterium]|jgi:N-acetylneuraminate lyase|nr:dihydrodipicolinate synthase family protein [Bacteroidales bacterium]
MESMLKIEKFKGLVAATFTPFDQKGNLNVSIINEYCSFLGKNGVSGIFINGTTGEGVSLSNKEKQINAAAWARAVKDTGKMRVINLVGGTSYQECIDNALFSKECGFSAIAILAPFFFRPDEGRLAEFIAKVGESVPVMPVYFYHIPELTGVNMPVIGLLRRISGMLPNFAGIKYTAEDLMDFLSCTSFDGGKYDILWGRDECLLAALATGAKGAVGSTYNYAAPLYHALIKAFNEGDLDEARRLQMKSAGIVELLGKYGGIATGKAFMRYAGIDCGKFRVPVYNMSDDMYPEFVKDIKALGIEDYFSKM